MYYYIYIHVTAASNWTCLQVEGDEENSHTHQVMSYSVWKLDFDLLNFRNTVVQHRFAILLTDAKTEITQSTPPNATVSRGLETPAEKKTGPIPSGACCLTRSSMSAKPTNNASNALSSPPFEIGGSLLGRMFSLRSGLIAQQAHQHLHPLQHQ